MTLREEIEKLRSNLPSNPEGFYGTDYMLGRLDHQVAMHSRLTAILDAHPTVPEPDWPNVPEWAEWVAVDADGEIYGFAHEPHVSTYVWLPGGGASRVEFLSQAPVPVGVDWRTLKWKRPEKAKD